MVILDIFSNISRFVLILVNLSQFPSISLFLLHFSCLPNQAPFGQHNSSSGSEATEVKPDVEESTLSELVPSVDDCTSQCSDTEVDHDLNGHSHFDLAALDPMTLIPWQKPLMTSSWKPMATSRCLSSTAPLGNDAETPLSDEELDKEFDIDFISKDTYDQTCKEDKASSYIEFPCIEPADSISVSSYVSSSRSGVLDAMDEPRTCVRVNLLLQMTQLLLLLILVLLIWMEKRYAESDRHSDDLSSPGSDSDIEGELEAAFACGPVASNMISLHLRDRAGPDQWIQQRALFASHQFHWRSQLPPSDQELDHELDPEQDSGILGLKASLLLGQLEPIKQELSPGLDCSPDMLQLDDGQALMGLQNVDDEQGYEHHADPDETLPPAVPCEG